MKKEQQENKIEKFESYVSLLQDLDIKEKGHNMRVSNMLLEQLCLKYANDNKKTQEITMTVKTIQKLMFAICYDLKSEIISNLKINTNGDFVTITFNFDIYRVPVATRYTLNETHKLNLPTDRLYKDIDNAEKLKEFEAFTL